MQIGSTVSFLKEHKNQAHETLAIVSRNYRNAIKIGATLVSWKVNK